MRKIVEMIANHCEKEECLLVTGISGAVQGEKLLYKNGAVVCETNGTKGIKGCEEAFLNIRTNDICQLPEGEVFVERFSQDSRIIVCGAGTVGLEVIKLAKMLGYPVVVLEDRKEYADIAAKLGADEVYCQGFEDGFAQLDERMTDYYIIMTREHQYDKVCLEHILEGKYAYVGMMASKNRGAMLKQTLEQEGYGKEELEKIYSPIGLPIKAETPAEIAVSVFAEVIRYKNESGRMEGLTEDILADIKALSPEEQGVLATIVKRTGSAPRDVGTRMLIREDGSITGSVGGGWIEAGVLKLAKEMLGNGMKYALYETEKDSEQAVLCGGYETIYLEMI